MAPHVRSHRTPRSCFPTAVVGTVRRSINSYTANPPHRYRPLLLALHLQTALPFFHRQNIQTPSVSHQQPHYIISALIHSSCHSPLITQSSPLHQNPKFTRSCPTVQTSSLTQIPYRPGFLKNVHPYLFPQSPILSTYPSSGQFHPTLNESIISPLLKKPTLDKEELSSYRPISNLSLISKITERVVKSHLTDHLTSNSLLNSHQSAYTANIILPKQLFYTSTITSSVQ